MNVKKDEDAFEDDNGAFWAHPADMELCLNRVAFPSGSGLCGPQFEQRNVAKLDAEAIAPVYPHQRLRRSSPVKGRCIGPLRSLTSAPLPG